MVEVLVNIKEFCRMFHWNGNTQSYHLQCGIAVPFENVTEPDAFVDTDGYSYPIREYLVRFKTEQEAVFFALASRGSVILE